MSVAFSLDSETVVSTLADLISIKSVNPRYPSGTGEADLAEYIGAFLKKNSIPCSFQPVMNGRSNVIGKIEGKPNGLTIVLEAHMDTATEVGMAAPFDPVRKGNLMYGRGSCDTKGGLAAMLHAMKKIAETKSRPSASVILVAAVDEEFSFQGVLKFLESGVKADGAIVAEPTDLQLVVASKGALRFRLQTSGRTAHSSRPELGVNAINKMARLILAMEQKGLPLYSKTKHPLLGAPTMNIGMIHGGVQVNQVPEICAIQVDRRLLPGESRETVWSEFEEMIRELCEADPELHIEMTPVLEDPPLETRPTERIVQVALQSLRAMGREESPIGVPYGSDASKLARAGIPSIIWGPGSIDQAHSAHEHVPLDQVVLAAELYARTILEF